MSTQTYVRIPVSIYQGWQSWEASIGSLREQASTKTKALANLADAIETGLRNYEPPALVRYGTLTAIVHADPSGSMTYRITDADGRESWVGISAETIAEGEVAALRSMVQRETDWHDDAAVWAGHDALSAAGDDEGAAEHVRYAAWQRAYRVAAVIDEAAGHSRETNPHEWATAHARDFTPVRAA